MTQASEPQNSNTSENAGVARAAAGLKLYDTASHTVSRFTPIKPGQVGIYVCGATVQSSPHIDRKSTRLNSSHVKRTRMPSSA